MNKKIELPSMVKTNKALFVKFFSYGVVGVIGTGVHFSTLIALVELFHQNPVVGSSIGFVLTVIVSYILNRKFTFRVKGGNHSIQFFRYLVVSCIGFLMNMLIMYVVVQVLSLYYLIGQSIVVIVLPIMNFILNNYWTFKEHRLEDGKDA